MLPKPRAVQTSPMSEVLSSYTKNSNSSSVHFSTGTEQRSGCNPAPVNYCSTSSSRSPHAGSGSTYKSRKHDSGQDLLRYDNRDDQHLLSGSNNCHQSASSSSFTGGYGIRPLRIQPRDHGVPKKPTRQVTPTNGLRFPGYPTVSSERVDYQSFSSDDGEDGISGRASSQTGDSTRASQVPSMAAAYQQSKENRRQEIEQRTILGQATNSREYNEQAERHHAAPQSEHERMEATNRGPGSRADRNNSCPQHIMEQQQQLLRELDGNYFTEHGLQALGRGMLSPPLYSPPAEPGISSQDSIWKIQSELERDDTSFATDSAIATIPEVGRVARPKNEDHFPRKPVKTVNSSMAVEGEPYMTPRPSLDKETLPITGCRDRAHGRSGDIRLSVGEGNISSMAISAPSTPHTVQAGGNPRGSWDPSQEGYDCGGILPIHIPDRLVAVPSPISMNAAAAKVRQPEGSLSFRGELDGHVQNYHSVQIRSRQARPADGQSEGWSSSVLMGRESISASLPHSRGIRRSSAGKSNTTGVSEQAGAGSTSEEDPRDQATSSGVAHDNRSSWVISSRTSDLLVPRATSPDQRTGGTKRSLLAQTSGRSVINKLLAEAELAMKSLPVVMNEAKNLELMKSEFRQVTEFAWEHPDQVELWAEAFGNWDAFMTSTLEQIGATEGREALRIQDAVRVLKVLPPAPILVIYRHKTLPERVRSIGLSAPADRLCALPHVTDMACALVSCLTASYAFLDVQTLVRRYRVALHRLRNNSHVLKLFRALCRWNSIRMQDTTTGTLTVPPVRALQEFRQQVTAKSWISSWTLTKIGLEPETLDSFLMTHLLAEPELVLQIGRGKVRFTAEVDPIITEGDDVEVEASMTRLALFLKGLSSSLSAQLAYLAATTYRVENELDWQCPGSTVNSAERRLLVLQEKRGEAQKPSLDLPSGEGRTDKDQAQKYRAGFNAGEQFRFLAKLVATVKMLQDSLSSEMADALGRGLGVAEFSLSSSGACQPPIAMMFACLARFLSAVDARAPKIARQILTGVSPPGAAESGRPLITHSAEVSSSIVASHMVVAPPAHLLLAPSLAPHVVPHGMAEAREMAWTPARCPFGLRKCSPTVFNVAQSPSPQSTSQTQPGWGFAMFRRQPSIGHTPTLRQRKIGSARLRGWSLSRAEARDCICPSIEKKDGAKRRNSLVSARSTGSDYMTRRSGEQTPPAGVHKMCIIRGDFFEMR